MEVGIYFDMRNPPQWGRPWADLYKATIDLCVEAERLGIDSAWFSEHHLFDDGYLPQPLTLAAAVAARTTRITLATAVLLPVLRQPLQLAEEAAIADIISGGRLELGFGVGYRPIEFDAFGFDIRNRYRLLEQRVVEIRRFWDGLALPPPVRNPIPLWGGFFGPRGARLAGRLGMGLLTIDAGLMDAYHQGLSEGGSATSSARVGGLVNLILADDPEAAWVRIRDHLAYQGDSYNDHAVRGTDKPPFPRVDPERMRQPRKDGSPPRFQVLTPIDATRFVLETTAGLPVQHVFFWASVGAMPDDLVQRNVELIATELAPALHGRGRLATP